MFSVHPPQAIYHRPQLPEPTEPSPPPQLAEEDECPVCHLELPPKGDGGSETAREAHIAACIESHFAPTGSSAPSSRPAPQTQQQPARESPHTSRPASSVLDPMFEGVAGPSSSAPPSAPGLPLPGLEAAPGPSRATARRRTTGMVAYHATEKDCLGEDGAPQECVICFEEFEPGVEMGRLECLCKFHKVRDS